MLKQAIDRIFFSKIGCEDDSSATYLRFTFARGIEVAHHVESIYSSPDIFEIKANTLRKILSGEIASPQAIEFGAERDGSSFFRMVFTCSAVDLFSVRITGFSEPELHNASHNAVFNLDVTRNSVEELLRGFYGLNEAFSGIFVWHIVCHGQQ